MKITINLDYDARQIVTVKHLKAFYEMLKDRAVVCGQEAEAKKDLQALKRTLSLIR